MQKPDQGRDAAPWIVRFAPLIPPGGRVLDLACGGGRHSRFLLAAGHSVTAVDRTLAGMEDLEDVSALEAVAADLEDGPWPFGKRHFAGIVVTNYLHRPLLPLLKQALAPDGVLIYETFAQGNEQFGRPSNPDFLLRPGELLDTFHPDLTVVAYEHGQLDLPHPRVVQRICAIRAEAPVPLPPG